MTVLFDAYLFLSLGLTLNSFSWVPIYLFIFSLLQILSSVLDMTPSSFGIKLAALASRKELVDLENWLSNNLNTYKDIFFEVRSGGPLSNIMHGATGK